MKKIGIYGGTFSPIHKAHIAVANQAKNEFGLDEVWFLVNHVPPHKDFHEYCDVFSRLKMCEIALSGYEGLYAKDFECYDLDKSYTRDTLKRLNERFPHYKFYFIMGGDSLFSFEKWVEPETISKYCFFLVALRDNIEKTHEYVKKAKELSEKFHTEFSTLSCPYIPLSSTDVREWIREGNEKKVLEAISYDVYSFIKSHRLFTIEKDYDVDGIREYVEKYQKKSRFEHCLRVADTAANLAAHYLFPVKTAYVTGLLHDCAKHYTGEKLLSLCEEFGIEVTPSEKESSYLLHGAVGAKLAQKEFGIDDEMAHAIMVHTRGSENMSLLDKIIFLADHIEPGRKRFSDLEHTRFMATRNIDTTVLLILQDTIKYLKQGNRPIDDTTMKTYNYYLNRRTI